jgi:hypothetical protein
MVERTPGDTEIAAALKAWAAARHRGDKVAALAAAQQAMAIARSANSPYLAVTAACVEHAGGGAADVPLQTHSGSCSFCGATEGVARLVAGPHVFVCESCVRGGNQEIFQGGPEDRCSFCNRLSSDSPQALATAHHSICANCMSTCAQILSGGQA